MEWWGGSEGGGWNWWVEYGGWCGGVMRWTGCMGGGDVGKWCMGGMVKVRRYT